jgi:alkanesulfonate monooxygenase SsuD/methylene tetrahydromethanopterin reductase-like flavin-dependent oxidoreductase (luciferase family)
MKVGIMVSNQQLANADMVSALHDQYLMVRSARDRGWDSYFAGQHYLNEGGNQGLQLVPYMARLQAEAGDMTMGLGLMLLTLHNPVYVAETIATLDVISGGNLVFGVGLGYRTVEFHAFGVRRGQRVKRFEECLSVAKRLWTEETVSHESDTCILDNVQMTLKPVQKPHPPIWFAAKHENALRRAARMGDCLYHSPKARLETSKRRLAIYKEELRKLGKPHPKENPGRVEIFCAKDRKTALELAGPYLSQKYQVYAQWEQDRMMPEAERLDLPFEQLLQDRFVIGSPEDCWEQLRPYWEELGVTHFVFRTHFLGMPVSHALYSMRMISDELLPELHKVKPTSLATIGDA